MGLRSWSHRWWMAAGLLAITSCSPFNPASDAAGDGGTVGDAQASSSIDGGGSDGGDGFACDTFERDTIVPHALWTSTGGDPAPTIQSGIVVLTAQSSAPDGGVMTSSVRTRGDTVEIKANVFIKNADFNTHTGRVRLVEIDGSLAGPPGERASVYFTNHWQIEWRDFGLVGGVKTEENKNVPVIRDQFFALVFTVRFAASGGFLRLAINGTTVLEKESLVLGGVARSTWHATIGIPSVGSTPALQVGLDNICFRP